MIIEQESKIDSSTIKLAFYNFTTKILKITFLSDAEYEYFDVPNELYDEFCKSESKGKFLNEKIKGTYKFSKIENND
jgi:hypothetical protein